MKFPRYTVRGLLDVLLLLPLITQFLFVMLFLLAGAGAYEAVPAVASVLGVGLLAASFLMGRRLILRTWLTEVPPRPESTFCRRYLPVLLALAFTLLVALVGLFIPSNENRAVFSAFGNIFALAHFPSSALLLLLFIFVPPTPWIMALPLAIYAANGFGMASAFRTLRIPRSDQWNGAVYFGLAAMVMGFIIGRSVTLREGVLVGGRDDYFADANEIEPYHPYEEDNRLVRVPEPGLQIAENHPVLDGATAAYPVYAAAVQAVYNGAEEKGVYSVLSCSKTSEAYQKLFDDNADIIFALQPSQAQLAAAKAAGVTLHFTPIAKEAFIFFVNSGNPVNGLTTAQVRAIYTKAITNWSELGGADQKIMAFQRPPNSGSQTALEELVMKGEKLAPAPREEVVGSMGGVMQRIATYHNTRSALGYSFRYYATTMNPIAGIKLLALDGVAPTPETIRSGTYPYTVELYAVTAGSKNPNTQALIDWFLSPAGQKMIEETGYVGGKIAAPADPRRSPRCPPE